MKLRLFAACLLASSFFLPSAASGEHLVLPDKIGDFQFIERENYEQPELGYSLRYMVDERCKADVYVYDNGIAGLPDGIDSRAVLERFESVVGVLKEFERRGKYADVKELARGKKTPDGSKVEFLWARHSYRQVSGEGVLFLGERISETYLVVHRGKFHKIRITVNGDAVESLQKDLDALVRAVARQIESN